MKANGITVLAVLAILLALTAAFFFLDQRLPEIWSFQHLIQLVGLVLTVVIISRFVRRRRSTGASGFLGRRPMILASGVCLILFSMIELVGVPELFPNLGSAGSAILVISFCIFMIVGVFLTLFSFYRA